MGVSLVCRVNMVVLIFADIPGTIVSSQSKVAGVLFEQDCNNRLTHNSTLEPHGIFRQSHRTHNADRVSRGFALDRNPFGAAGGIILSLLLWHCVMLRQR
jgi:hypothetical protein